MVNPLPRAGEQLVLLFRQLSEQVGLPLMIQDIGPGASVEILLRSMKEAPHVARGRDRVGRRTAQDRETGERAA